MTNDLQILLLTTDYWLRTNFQEEGTPAGSQQNPLWGAVLPGAIDSERSGEESKCRSPLQVGRRNQSANRGRGTHGCGVGCAGDRRIRASPSSFAGTCHRSTTSMRPGFGKLGNQALLVVLPKELSAGGPSHLRRGGQFGKLTKLGEDSSGDAGCAVKISRRVRRVRREVRAGFSDSNAVLRDSFEI